MSRYNFVPKITIFLLPIAKGLHKVRPKSRQGNNSYYYLDHDASRLAARDLPTLDTSFASLVRSVPKLHTSKYLPKMAV